MYEREGKVKRRKRKGKGDPILEFFFHTYGNITVFENLSLCKNEMSLRLCYTVNKDSPVNFKINVRTEWEDKKQEKKRDLSFFTRYYLPTPPLGQDMTQGQFLSGV